jgi:glycine betaine transporter
MKKLIGDNSVFSISLLITSLLVVLGVFFNGSLSSVSSWILNTSIEYFGWFYLLSTLLFVFFSAYLLFSKYGRVRLGDESDKPTFSTPSWLAMLFSAGMGVGLLFWGVAEPIFHYVTPPIGEGSSVESANLAMTYSFFHWGLHPWAVYTVVALSLAYFQFRKKLPALISSAFYPLLKDKIYGPIGKSIDILSIFATVFGVATSLGLGTMQISGGLHYLYGVPNSIPTQLSIIAIITLLFMISAWTGLSKGIKILSNVNVILAIFLLAVLIVIGPTSQIFGVFTNTMGNYLNNFMSMSLNLRPFGDNSWIAGWTLFYWAWWIAWAPFVGSFIARVSKGRTIKEFITGVLIVPILGTFVWFSAMGGSALDLIQNKGKTALAEQATSDVTIALFSFFEYLPFSTLLSVLAVVLVITFFVTSADSATFILGMFSSNGSLHPKARIKLTWGVILSLVSAVLLLSGSLETLQTASIAAALPFAVIMVCMCYSLKKGLESEVIEPKKRKRKKNIDTETFKDTQSM